MKTREETRKAAASETIQKEINNLAVFHKNIISSFVSRDIRTFVQIMNK